ncbi:MAG TPA: class I SAM-dependent rRNA methyltransferase [Vicinamibacterales bacterium]|nr:class I SAM-dependent rRNA methyltransferase [Vicinamibacterales bacterium]
MSSPVVISRRGADRVRAGHPWVYRSDIVRAEAEPGDLVRVEEERRRALGWALWSSESQIAIRMIATQSAGARQANVEERALFETRLRAAMDYRASLAIDGTACRLVHGEADRLPALVVDRYGDGRDDYLVIQTLCQGMDRRIGLIVELLGTIVRPRGILARNDPKVRRLEGLDERVEVLAGEVPDTVEVREGDVTYRADLRHGQKTGLFLDQRENHLAAARYARGRALDGFTYHGGFALHLARHAASVLALDSSGAAVAATRANAARNGLTTLEAREANVFDELRELETSGERFDTIVLDPPAFAKNRAAVERAAAGYKEINLRALRLLSPGGHLITCSCSYNVNEALFQAIVEDAAIDAHATVALVEKRMQARDHPVLLGVPETHYLKCLILRRVA